MRDSFAIQTLGPCQIPSPLVIAAKEKGFQFPFVDEDAKVLFSVSPAGNGKAREQPSFQAAGPRARIYFDPAKVHAGIVSCGGLSPGLNNVIRAIVMQLFYQYGVRQVHGFLYGFQGFIPKYAHPMVELTPESVKGIHSQGGSILMSSRGHQDIGEIVDCLEQNHLNLLFTIGGDGTLRGAHLIAQEVLKRGLKIAVIGVPKTIDNDIAFCVKTFGFETAFAKAVESIQSAHVEATGAPYGIVIVKLMGRDSGFIAANTSLACPDVNVVLVPELPFTLDGENGLLKVLERRLRKLVEERRHPHAVIAVAEGAGQELMESSGEQDPSGNVRYGDIGQFLKAKITEYFKDKLPINLKSIEPSYMIRSLPANPSDAIFCFYLADHVVHAAMAGKTDMMVGFWNGHFTHVPLTQVTKGRKKIDTGSDFWRQVLYSTGQPARML